MTQTKPKPRRSPVPKDIQAGRDLLTELIDLRQDVRDMRDAATKANREMMKLVRDNNALKARLAAKAKGGK